MNILISIGKDADPSNYLNAVTKAGSKAHAAYLPSRPHAFDALILAGGGDISPHLFGQKSCGSQQIDLSRDLCELALMDAFTKAKKPILGICRGHQVVNVWAGGGIIQDLGEQNAIHCWDGDEKTHLVSGSGILEGLYGSLFRVNSAHHQSVGPLGKNLKVTARSADGVIEAMEHCFLPILTTQFHPERMKKPDTAPGERIFRWFIENSAGL